MTVLDVGCGPGALTGALAERLGADHVAACDPTPVFVDACASRFPDATVRAGAAESLPFDDDAFDAALAQLVLHFVSEPSRAAQEMGRVVRSGGVVGACVWDFAGGMEMLRYFWDAAQRVRPTAPDEANTMRFGRPGEIVELFDAAGFVDVVESTLEVSSTYDHFDELWAGFRGGVGPAGAFLLSLPDDEQARVERALFDRVGAPAGRFTLTGLARCAIATVP